MQIESREMLYVEEDEAFKELEVQVIDILRQNELLDLRFTRSENEKTVQNRHLIRTDSHILIYQQDLWGQGLPPNASIHPMRSVQSVMAATPSIGRLIGYLRGDKVSLSKVLTDSSYVSIGKQMENVNGFNCYLIEASGRHGNYKVWIDPLYGYGIRQLQVRKNQGHLLFGERIQSEVNPSDKTSVQFELTVKDIQLHKFEDIFIPTQEIVTISQKQRDGMPRIRRSIIKRFNVRFEPRYMTGDFKMSEIPEGTQIFNFDETNYGYGYEWRDNKIVPVAGGGTITIIGQVHSFDNNTSLSDNVTINAEIRPLEIYNKKFFDYTTSLDDPTLRNYDVKVSKEGRLRIENVPAGQHHLEITVLEQVSSSLFKPLATIERKIPVAASDQHQTIDLGVLKFSPVLNLNVGDLAPEFELRALDGRLIRLSKYRGQFVLLDFWASWCSPCIAEFSHIGDVSEKFADNERFSVIGLCLDKDKDTCERTVKKHALNWTQLLVGDMAEQISYDYSIYGIPAIFLIDPEGRIAARDLRGKQVGETISQLISDDLAKNKTTLHNKKVFN
jgi:peroxiredoxin